MLRWLTRDALLIFAARAVRSLAYGFLAVMLPIYLDSIGLSAVRIGVVLTFSLAGGAALTLFSGLFADRLGRRRLLVAYAVLMALAGGAFAVTESYPLLLVGAFIGVVGSASADGGPPLPLEQAILPERLPDRNRTDGFAIFSAMGSLAVALGALMAGLPALLERWPGLSAEAAFRAMFLLAIALALATAACYLPLSSKVELDRAPRTRGPAPRLPSKGIIARLSLVFGVDSFGGGFVLQSFVAYWFFIKFAMALETLAWVFFVAGLLSSLSFFAATWLARRIGLVNTMVFTHVPANFLLLALPFAPTAAVGLVLYLARTALSQMDVPTRQSYTVAVVRPEERVAAAGATTLARNVARVGTPSLAGYLLQAASLSAPFLVGGGVKLAYNVALFVMFRKIKPPEEQLAGAAALVHKS